MGLPIDKERFTEAEYARFQERLARELVALRALLERPGFGRGPESLGAELESSIVDGSGQVLPVNEAVLEGSEDPRLQLELVAFNLEANLTPMPARGASLSTLEAELDETLSLMEELCVVQGGHVAPIGIVPSLRAEDVGQSRITPQARYRALVTGVERLQPSPLHIDIHGPEESLAIQSETAAIEGSNTSFQVHLRVDPEKYADTYNAAQLATPIALALGANSPFFFGKVLWDETRVPLFKQSLAGRTMPPGEWHPVVRVPFGHGWVRKGIFELFAESVALHPPILAPSAEEEPSLRIVHEGGVPELRGLRLHQGSIWQWNRAVYDPAGGGHVRIELRALPAGPTPIDMAANAAFLLGLVAALREEVDHLLPAFPFRYAEHNFYRAAQRGLDAVLLWPTGRAPSPEERPLLELVDELLPRAEEGLDRLGVDAADIARYLAVIRARRESKTTSARWLRRGLGRLEAGTGREEALARLTLAYLDRVRSRAPVHTWTEAG